MKISQLRRMASVGQRAAVSGLKADISGMLGESGIDAASLYQEIEMDSLFFDTH